MGIKNISGVQKAQLEICNHNRQLIGVEALSINAKELCLSILKFFHGKKAFDQDFSGTERDYCDSQIFSNPTDITDKKKYMAGRTRTADDKANDRKTSAKQDDRVSKTQTHKSSASFISQAIEYDINWLKLDMTGIEKAVKKAKSEAYLLQIVRDNQSEALKSAEQLSDKSFIREAETLSKDYKRAMAKIVTEQVKARNKRINVIDKAVTTTRLKAS